MGKLAIKRLTDSDLTLFEWQFRNKNAGNQKSINLNADVFIDRLYSSLPETDVGRRGKITLDLFLYGPGHARAYNLQRKIIKGRAYKNWRLNGEYIPNPLDQLDRFNSLAAGDFVIFDFEGDLFPTAARAVFVAQNLPEDARLHAGIQDSGVGSMQAIDLAALWFIVHASGTSEAHPVYELLLDAAIEDASQGGLEGTSRLLGRNTGRRITRSELERARQRADDVGLAGEELMDAYFESRHSSKDVESHVWVADENAIAAFDFTVKLHGQPNSKVEVKSTSGKFTQILHLSVSQLIEIRDSADPYHIYRVYELDDRYAKLRIATDVRAFAEQVLDRFSQLPQGVTVDSISIRPETLPFGTEMIVDVPDNGDHAANV